MLETDTTSPSWKVTGQIDAKRCPFSKSNQTELKHQIRALLGVSFRKSDLLRTVLVPAVGSGQFSPAAVLFWELSWDAACAGRVF